MKNKFILGYSIIASAFILFAVSFFSFNLYREYSFGESRTNTNFIRMVSRIKSTSYQNNLYDENYSSKLVQAIGNFDDISFIEIKRDGQTVLAYPDADGKTSTTKLTKKYEDKNLIRESTLEIEAGLYLLRPISIHYYAKISFLMILIITITTVILIIYIQMKESEEVSHSNIVEKDDDFFETEDEKDIDDQDDFEDFGEESESEESENIAEESENSPDSSEANTPAPEAEKVEEDNNEPVIEAKQEDEAKSDASEPNGLFSPVTGIGWESYLMTRLENEVSRAIASEMDLALFVIQVPDSKRNSEIIKNTCNYLAIQFQFKDLLFEYKDDCIAAMKINMNLDEALNFADKLHADITNIVSTDDKKCFIGISTRSIRIVAAERLFTEAEQALCHAREDKDSPIIAFRADSEKYRQYLDENR